VLLNEAKKCSGRNALAYFVRSSRTNGEKRFWHRWQDPEIIDPGLFGFDEETTFHRFEFNDYPSEVFFPHNDFYTVDDDGGAVENGDAENDGALLKVVGSDNWIRKSYEQLTSQNLTPSSRQKFPTRSKSLESEARTANAESDAAENVATTECDSFYDVKATSFSCDCDTDGGDGDSRQNESVVQNKNVEMIGG
jgi:hypothetical protein